MKPATVCPYCGATIGPRDYGCRVCGFRHGAGSPNSAQAYCLVGALGGFAMTSTHAYDAFSAPAGNQLGEGTIALIQSGIFFIASIWLLLVLLARSKSPQKGPAKVLGATAGLALAWFALALCILRIGDVDLSLVLLAIAGIGLLVTNLKAILPER